VSSLSRSLNTISADTPEHLSKLAKKLNTALSKVTTNSRHAFTSDLLNLRSTLFFEELHQLGLLQLTKQSQKLNVCIPCTSRFIRKNAPFHARASKRATMQMAVTQQYFFVPTVFFEISLIIYIIITSPLFCLLNAFLSYTVVFLNLWAIAQFSSGPRR